MKSPKKIILSEGTHTFIMSAAVKGPTVVLAVAFCSMYLL
jgi:hypothetical protein